MQHRDSHTLSQYTIAIVHTPEVFSTLVDGPIALGDILGQQLRVDVDEGVVHPGLVPLEPVRSCHPEILERLKVSSQFANFVIL